LADKIWEIFVPGRNSFYFDDLCYEAHFEAFLVAVNSGLHGCRYFTSLVSKQLIDSTQLSHNLLRTYPAFFFCETSSMVSLKFNLVPDSGCICPSLVSNQLGY